MTISGDKDATQTRALIVRFWELMATNRFDDVAEVLSEDFTIEWPQTKERIRGALKFARFNQEYPAHGPWTFQIKRLIAEADEGVSEVIVSDGVQGGRPITFFRIRDGLIDSIVEYWPDASEPLTERAHLTEVLTNQDLA